MSKNLFTLIRPLCASLAFVVFPSGAHAIQTEPVEIIRANPVSTFSDRSGSWPSTEIHQDDLNPEVRPLTDTLNTVPGLQARDQGSPTLSIRGSGQADRVLKLYEGIPLNFADGLGASNFFIPSETLGSLRLIKGPSSVFYGPSAMGGALDHRTRLFDQPAVRVAAEDDRGLLLKQSLFGVVPFGKSRASQISGFYEDDPGRFAFDSDSGFAGGRRELNETRTKRASYIGDDRVLSDDVHIKPIVVLSQQDGSVPGPLYSPYQSSYDLKGTLLAVESNYKPAPSEGRTEFGLRLSDTRLWREDTDVSGASSSANARSAASLDWKQNLFTDDLVRTFIDARTDSLTASYVGGGTLYETDVEVGQAYQIPLSSTLLLEPAFRYLPHYGQVLKAMELQYIRAKTQAWALYSEGFRNASLTDRFAVFNGFQGNPGLQPESSQGVELGMKWENGRRFGGTLEGLSASLTGYLTHYDQLVETSATGSNPFTKVNSGAARSQGVEVELAYGHSVWTATVAQSFLDAYNESTRESLRLSPGSQTSFVLSNQLGPAVIELKDTLWSHYYDRDQMSVVRDLHGWNTLDLSVRTLGLIDWEIRAGVWNIFDVPRELTYGFPEPQRRFYVSAMRAL